MIYYFRAAAAAGPSIFGLVGRAGRLPGCPTNQDSTTTTIYPFRSKLTFKVVQDRSGLNYTREDRASSTYVQTADDDLMSDDDGVEPVEKVVVNNNIYP